MQLSNEPAEELAKFLCDSSDGAFDLVGFVSGGSEAMEGVIKLSKQVIDSCSSLRDHPLNVVYHSTGTRKGKKNERIS